MHFPLMLSTLGESGGPLPALGKMEKMFRDEIRSDNKIVGSEKAAIMRKR